MAETPDELTPRQRMLLGLIIREYISSPARSGVSSKILAERYDLNISSATIRNEMSDLTERGYLRQPHTSAGRVPTEEGYRYFVSRLVSHQQHLPLAEQRQISHQFHQARRDVQHWSHLAASVLARHTRIASLATQPYTRQPSLRHIELISTRGSQILLVLVLDSGEVCQQIFALDETLPQRQLSETSARINEKLSGTPISQLPAILDQAIGIERHILGQITNMMAERLSITPIDYVHDGVTYILTDEQSFDNRSVLQTIRILEERSFLQSFLGQTLAPKVGGIQVLIGGEGIWEELRDLSMVLAPYGVKDVATGAIGVIGPTHMAYGRAISTVRYVSGLLTELVYENFTSN